MNAVVQCKKIGNSMENSQWRKWMGAGGWGIGYREISKNLPENFPGIVGDYNTEIYTVVHCIKHVCFDENHVLMV